MYTFVNYHNVINLYIFSSVEFCLLVLLIFLVTTQNRFELLMIFKNITQQKHLQMHWFSVSWLQYILNIIYLVFVLIYHVHKLSCRPHCLPPILGDVVTKKAKAKYIILHKLLLLSNLSETTAAENVIGYISRLSNATFLLTEVGEPFVHPSP